MLASELTSQAGLRCHFSFCFHIEDMAYYACKSWPGSAAREDVCVISVGGNGQAWSSDSQVAHTTINVAVRPCSHMFVVAVSVD